MKILALDTSSNVATVAIAEDNKLICEYTLNHKKTHSQKLMPMIQDLFAACEMTVQDIDAIAVAVGPGSFTGLRIGIATAKALAHAANKPVVSVSTLDAMAYNLPFCSYTIVPIMDARRSQVYTGVYKWSASSLITLHAPKPMAIDELCDILNQGDEPAVFIGDGVPVHEAYIRDALGVRAIFGGLHYNMQRASSVAACGIDKAKRGELLNYNRLLPEYHRLSQAEREYNEKESKD